MFREGRGACAGRRGMGAFRRELCQRHVRVCQGEWVRRCRRWRAVPGRCSARPRGGGLHTGAAGGALQVSVESRHSRPRRGGAWSRMRSAGTCAPAVLWRRQRPSQAPTPSTRARPPPLAPGAPPHPHQSTRHAMPCHPGRPPGLHLQGRAVGLRFELPRTYPDDPPSLQPECSGANRQGGRPGDLQAAQHTEGTGAQHTVLPPAVAATKPNRTPASAALPGRHAAARLPVAAGRSMRPLAPPCAAAWRRRPAPSACCWRPSASRSAPAV